MKKNHLLFSLLFICCALVMVLGSIGGAVAQAQALTVQAAADEVPALFNADGSYAVQRSDLVKGAKFNFFGYTWRVVYRNDDEKVVTFWMDEPMADAHSFNPAAVSGATQTLENTWCNGYTSSKLTIKSSGYQDIGGDAGESAIRAYLREIANNLLNNSQYAKYKDKVVKGQVQGTNYDKDKSKASITKVRYAKDGTHYVAEPKDGDTVIEEVLEINYALTDDVLWLPCEEEIKANGLWQLNEVDRAWNNTTNANAAWLRNPFLDSNANPLFEGSHLGMVIGFENTVENTYSSQGFFGTAINKAQGVRPAIHLNIASLDQENGDGSNGGNKGSLDWWNDNIMKVFFIIICVLGVIGVVLVITAVIIKAHQRKKAATRE